MEVTSLSISNMYLHGSLLTNLFRARKETFIDLKLWELPQADGMEYDQYDTPACKWIAVHDGSEVVAGVRLMPTTVKVGMYSYMIRDAQRGLLPSIPDYLLDFDAPVDPEVWEATRIFVSRTVPATRRTQVQLELMQALISEAYKAGAKKILAFGPAVWPRWLGRLNLSASAAGPKMILDGVEVQTAIMNIGHKRT